jgi:hypothetical protein
MKKIFFLAMTFIAIMTASAQQSNWKEMHDFHSIMSVTFHPAEDNDLQPVKDSASALLAKAQEWNSSKVPAGYNGSVTKPILKRLVAECAALESAVKLKKTDNDLKTMITKAHNTFHEIMEKCRKEEH